MFDSLQEAIALGDQKNRKDGGVPIFEWRAMPKAGVNQEEVEYEDVVWVKIFNKGDPKNIIERPLREEDKKRWPEHWKAFEENSEPPAEGIPLEDFPQITPAERMKCKALHLRTVEDLVDYPDGQIKDLGGRGHALKKAAREFIEYKSGESITDLKDQIEALQKELKELKDGNSTGNSASSRSGNKSSKASNVRKRKRSNRKNKAASDDDGEAAGEA